MALAIVVTLEKQLPTPTAATAYAKAKTGKALARESERLETAARSRGVSSLTSLVSQSQTELRTQMQEAGFDPSKMRLAPELWFAADEGLKTVRGLADYVTARLNDFKQPNPILRDLKVAESLLTAAEAAGVRFHFSKADL